MATKTAIATCCYCGARAVVKLKGKRRNELTCESCGATLNNLEAAKVGSKKSRSKDRDDDERQPFWRRALKDIWDEVEDIFD